MLPGCFTQPRRAFFFFYPRVKSLAQPCLSSAEYLGGLLQQLAPYSSSCLQERQELEQESRRGLCDPVTLVDRLKVMESI